MAVRSSKDSKDMELMKKKLKPYPYYYAPRVIENLHAVAKSLNYKEEWLWLDENQSNRVSEFHKQLQEFNEWLTKEFNENVERDF